MKGKQIVVRALQDEINSALEKYSGKRYENGSYHAWFKDEVTGILSNHDIREMRPYVWDMGLNAQEHGISLGVGDRIGKFNVDLKQDKRIKWGPGRGKVNSMNFAFREDIINMTLDEARRLLFEEKRAEYIQRLEGIRNEALKQIEDAEAGIAELRAAQF